MYMGYPLCQEVEVGAEVGKVQDAEAEVLEVLGRGQNPIYGLNHQWAEVEWIRRDKRAGVDLTQDRREGAGADLTQDWRGGAGADLNSDRREGAGADLNSDRQEGAGADLTPGIKAEHIVDIRLETSLSQKNVFMKGERKLNPRSQWGNVIYNIFISN